MSRASVTRRSAATALLLALCSAACAPTDARPVRISATEGALRREARRPRLAEVDDEGGRSSIVLRGSSARAVATEPSPILDGERLETAAEHPESVAERAPSRRVATPPTHAGVLEREVRAHPALAATEWRTERTAHFLVFREAFATAPTPLAAFEDARAGALGRLGLTEASVPRSTLVPIFVFETEASFRLSAITTIGWADGCASFTPDEDEVARTIYITNRGPGALPELVRHEVAHIFAHEAFGDIRRTWVVEGIACYAEDDVSRWRYRDFLGTNVALSLDVIDGTRYEDLTKSDAYQFYCRAHAVFDALVRRTGSVAAALVVAREVVAIGVQEGFARSGISARAFEEEIANELLAVQHAKTAQIEEVRRRELERALEEREAIARSAERLVGTLVLLSVAAVIATTVRRARRM